MSFLSGIIEKFKNWKAKQEERARFQKLVDKETLPIKREGYLKEKKKQAIEEGKMIAKKELQKKKEPKRSEFGLPQVPINSNQFVPTENWNSHKKLKRRKK